MSKSTPVSNHDRLCLTLAWAISALVAVLAVLNWGISIGWHVSPNAYVLFPIMGLLAFSLMWSHYVAGFIRRSLGVDKAVLRTYFESTSLLVLMLLLLHPGLLILQRFRDGYGLPPHSYETYVAPGLGWITLLGSTAWFAFIAFEFRRYFADRSWWKYVPMAGDAAMLAIVYHSLRLGTQLQTGWFRGVWYAYAVVMVFILAYNYYEKFENRSPKT